MRHILLFICIDIFAGMLIVEFFIGTDLNVNCL